jgi:hypothetical protein
VQEVAIQNSGPLAKDAVIQVLLKEEAFRHGDAKAEGADLRFTTKAKGEIGPGLPYWAEQWNEQGLSRIWVKVPRLAAHATTRIYLHYGNAQAQPVSNGEATFLFFDDFESGDITRKWTNQSIQSVVEEGGVLKLTEADGEEGTITSNFDVKGPMIIRSLYQRERGDGHWVRPGIGGWNHWLCWGDHTETDQSTHGYVMLYDSPVIRLRAPLARTQTAIPDPKWHRITYLFDGKTLKGWEDDVMVAFPAENAASKLAFRTLDNDAADIYAYITVSPYTGPEPTVTVGPRRRH